MNQTQFYKIYFSFPYPEMGTIRPESSILPINAEAGESVRKRVSMTPVLLKQHECFLRSDFDKQEQWGKRNVPNYTIRNITPPADFQT